MDQLEFIALLGRLDPNVKLVDLDAPLSSVAFLIAADRWIRGVPDTEDSRRLRNELIYLLNNEKFSWESP